MATTLLLLGWWADAGLVSRQEHRRAHAQRAQDLGDAIAAHVETVLTAIEGDLRGVVELVRDDETLMTLGNLRLARHLGALKTWSMSIGAINVFDAHGVLVASSVASASLGQSLGDSPRFARFRDERNDGALISDRMVSGLLGQPAFSITLGAYARDGRFLGMIGALIPTATFIELFTRLAPTPDTRLALLREDGQILIAHPRRAGEPRAAATEEPMVATERRLARHGLVAAVSIPASEIDRIWLVANRGNLTAHGTLALIIIGLNATVLVWLRRRHQAAERDHHEHEQRQSLALAASEARFRDGIESMSVGFALWDSGDRLVAWNTAYERLFPRIVDCLRPGLAYDDLLTIAAAREWPDWDGQRRQQLVEKRLADRGRADRLVIALADGRQIETTERRTVERGIVCLFRDVTLERQIGERLLASDALFRDGIEAMHDGFLLLDAEDRVAAWNSAFRRMLSQLSTTVRVGLPFSELVRADLEASAAGDPTLDVDALHAGRMARHTGSGEPIELRSAIEGRIIVATERRASTGAIVIIYRDETELRNATTTLNQTLDQLRVALEAEREMNAQQRRFIAMASHEFRTPLAIIDGAAQRMSARIDDAQPEIGKRILRIRDAVRRMTGLIESTLSSTRLDEGRIAFEPAALDLPALIRDVVDRQMTLSPDFDFALDIAAAPASIEADARLLDQILTNLLSNAVKYSGASRRVVLRATVDDGNAVIAVRDFGLGVAPDELDRLFTRFFRARTATGIAGTGIGLSLVRDLTRMHGGTVAVESTLDAGSTFTVRLPLRQAATGAVA